MKLRKVGDDIPLKLDEVIKSYGKKRLENEAAVARQMVAGEEQIEVINQALEQGLKDLEKKAKPFRGMVLEATHLGWAEAERWRLEAEALDLANAAELRDLKKAHTAAEWPELHEGKVAAPGGSKRMQGYMRSVLEALISPGGLTGLEGITNEEQPDELADIILGLGLGNVVVPALLDAQRPTAEQVF